MKFKNLVRRGRLALGYSARALAEKIGVSHSYVSQIERGVIQRPSPMVLKRLADVLPDVAYWELLRVCGYTGELRIADREEALAEVVDPIGDERRRTIAARLWEMAGELARGWPREDALEERDFRTIPVFTTIPASFGLSSGAPVFSYDEFETVEVHESNLKGDPRAFALLVKGDSMVEAGILEGDIVVVSPNTPYQSGDICVVRVNGGDDSIKRLVIQDDIIVLQPCNSSYDPLVVDTSKGDELFVYGKVIHLERTFL